MALNQNTPSRLWIGAAYYPEHWPEARWDEDIHLMQEAGLNVVRMAEFAWSSLEPSAGQFEFAWLDRAIEALAAAGISTVMGTPTAAPPAWLVSQYPDMLAMDERGRRVQFGNRCHYCVTSPEFHQATRRIVAAMAEHFGPNPHVIGWQLDNEYGRTCTCDRCRSRFQAFLAARFGSLDALNQAWSTTYWSQTYSAWDQIPIPIGPHNPGLMLEYKRFFTDCYVRFQRLQLDALRPSLKPGDWVTHNFMAWNDGFDHYAMNADLDMASWDWYVGSGHHDYAAAGAIHDLTRGFKGRNFWVMETQPGSVNWSPVNNMLNKGEGRVMAWHAVAHGADGVLYWQWRSALGGQEQYHGTLVDQSGRPRPFYGEVKALAKEIRGVSDLLAGSTPVANVALLNDYESRWSIQWQRHHHDFDYVAHFNHYYRPLAMENIATDVISADAPLEGYALVIAPALLIMTGERAGRLKEFVASGGRLVLTLRTGMKDRQNALLPVRQPGYLFDLAGVEVEEYYALDEPVPVAGQDVSGTSTRWAEWLRVLDADQTTVLARYGTSNGWLDGQPAITRHAYGKGQVYVVGAYLDAGVQLGLMKIITAEAGIKPVMAAPAGVEVRQRVTPAGQVITLVTNHERNPQALALPYAVREHLSGSYVVSSLLLEPYGVAVLTPA